MSSPEIVNGRTKFYLDMDRVPELIADLDAVRAKFEEVRKQAQQLGNPRPPFADGVTEEVFRKIAERAMGGWGNLHENVAAMSKWIDDFKAAVQQAFDEHQRIDQDNTEMG
ncbi:hypothetical protein OU415_23280 [Saccharopolyspora sp. WRP15-2]|uniref:PE domain-containing protein n=1 Tax=Saccharopolyspora oryzae TaxID=2997343 RepID=A0ABT4V4P7_9PSEU|nr:hypothetical protein [Saccharopolyspora oryzae]MDA3628374.1 hypothetical protein [Saccharopolyspora oryzae]